MKMACFAGQRLRSTSIWAAVLVLFSQVPAGVLGLRTSSGSPCETVCNPSNVTTSSEIVCEDYQYNTTSVGRQFQSCISCQLESAYIDDATGQTDVDWGLYNLRYAFTSCVYSYPEEVNSVSSPCHVACQGLSTALEYDLRDPSGLNFETWCGTSSFADNAITTCEVCYNLTNSQPNSQVYLSNFLEALRYNCHFETPTDKDFPITPSRIFTESMLPSSTVNLISPSPGSGSGTSHLALVIALPILGVVILLCVLTIGCFFFIRSRRKKARRLRQSGHLHARWNDTSISTPQWATEYPVQAQGMYSPAMYQQGYSGGFGFVDTDGRGQEVGYSKVIEPVIASPSAAYSPEEKVPQTHPTYFPPPPLQQPNNGKMKQAE